MEKIAARFQSSHTRTLDSKGRLILPPEYRDCLLAHSKEPETCGFWLTGFYERLVAYFPEDWEKMSEQLCAIPSTNVRLSLFKSKVMGLASFITFDAQGRIRIPQQLLREGGLTKDCVLVGLRDKFEIWDQGRFDRILTNEDISEAIKDSGLQISL